jgi:hypothetical protein
MSSSVVSGVPVQAGYVFLTCKKIKSKLRVKILSQGYYNDANCQFPRDIRQEGAIFKVPVSAIKLLTAKSGRYFYSVKQKHHIEIVEGGSISSTTTSTPSVDLSQITVFEDTTLTECAVCYDAPKSMVFVPCGHFYTCATCSKKCDKCPICRVSVTQTIDKSLID